MTNQARRVATNVLFSLATQLVSWMLTFGVTLYLPRYAKDTGLGAITLAASISGLASVLVGLGTSTVLIKGVAQDISSVARLVVAGIALRAPLAVATFGLAWCIAHVLQYGAPLRALIYLSIVAMGINQLTDVMLCALRGVEDFPRQNLIAIIEKFLVSAGTIALILTHRPLWEIVGLSIPTGLVTLVLGTVAVKQHVRRNQRRLEWRTEWHQIKSLVFAAAPFLTSSIFMAAYGQTDALVLSKMTNVATIGWYGLATRLGGSTLIIPTTLCATMLPMLVRVHQEDLSKFVRISHRLFNLMIVCVVPFASVLIFVPAQILHILNYPPSFRPCIPVLMTMGLGIIFWFLSQAAGTALVASDRQYVFGRVMGLAALASLPLCALGIVISGKLMRNGAVGALASDVLLEVFLTTSYIYYLPKGIVTWSALGVFIRALLAASPSLVMFYIARNGGSLILPGNGLLLYVPLCLLFGCVDPEDIEIIKSIVRRQKQ